MHRVGLYPGTFDPIHNGHLDILARAVKLVDKLVIGVAINIGKGPMFSLDERVEMVKRETNHLTNIAEIEVRPFQTLLMHFARDVGDQRHRPRPARLFRLRIRVPDDGDEPAAGP